MTAQQEQRQGTAKKDERVRVCFVCTGNTCRSPMAAAALNHLAGDRFIAQSAGLCASGGQDMSAQAKEALLEKGITPPPHIARPLTESLLQENDLVIGMTDAHFLRMVQMFPAYASKCEGVSRDIGDPFGGDLAVYSRCLDEILSFLQERFCL
ncbi:MAG: low molecular weight protein arginine phosphatase [Clostridiales bacterium]|nr:low molecular weight protein arginine phosphatase [Clostridiales bacterium]